MAVNRRTFLLSFGTCAMVQAFPRASNAEYLNVSEEPQETLAAQSHSLPRTFRRVGENGFVEALNASFQALPPELINPFTVLVTNRNVASARAYGITWRYLSEEGSLQSFTRVFVSTVTTRRKRIAYTGAKILLMPGDAAIATPTSFLSSIQYSRSRLPEPSSQSALIAKANKFIAERPPQSRVYSSLTTRIYSRVASGTAPEDVLRSYQLRRAAEHDEALAIFYILAERPELSLVEAVSFARGNMPTDRSEDYYKHRRVLAACLVKRSTTIDRNGLLAILMRGKRLRVNPLRLAGASQLLPWGADAPNSITMN